MCIVGESLNRDISGQVFRTFVHGDDNCVCTLRDAPPSEQVKTPSDGMIHRSVLHAIIVDKTLSCLDDLGRTERLTGEIV